MEGQEQEGDIENNIPVEEVEGEEKEQLSAFRDNIAKKGSNAYYFAHINTPTGPEWDGKKEPKLLHKTAVAVMTPPQSAFDYRQSNITSYAFADGDKSIKLYIDKKTLVGDDTETNVSDDEVVVDKDDNKNEVDDKVDDAKDDVAKDDTEKDDGGNSNATMEEEEEEKKVVPPFLEEHEIELEHSTTSLSIRVPTQNKCLIFNKLAGAITKATYKLKEECLVVILKKEQPGQPWSSITSIAN
mmetsp:Transcript_11276/g.12910  ORF Transcript_11276/g.12910 Transcript_11276/m.12910 type:complete len:242 (-) Transcript_11276:424-1149(-)|eukprot:CAMPEP_0194142008 /NCGR_PEP_ID=MMETSP0152-20130528/11331_1 /TAXON_ID=1049557 /ORGANISM="Thalassiothrix antarctica, Strain L6-D1" /LENGTH=241 /DNA_ID=CAMNT_0038840805 /DNA_START=97 /DNA_END=822 /DNA_ORIENTATION=+